MASWQGIAGQLRNKGVDYKIVEQSSKGPQIRVCCPLCGDQRYRLYFGVQNGWAFCHNECGRITQEEFYALFGLNDLNVTSRSDFKAVVDQMQEDRSIKRVKWPKMVDMTLAWHHPAAHQYLQKRGVNREQAERYMLWYCDYCSTHLGYSAGCTSCRFSQRIIIPILRVGYVGRDITGKSDIRYRNADGAKMAEALLVSPQVKREAILVEGVWDFFHLERLGLPGVCTFGKELSRVQLDRLQLASLTSIIFLWDADRPGREAAQKVAERYSQGPDCWVASLPEGRDPDECVREEIDEALKEAKQYSSSLGRR